MKVTVKKLPKSEIEIEGEIEIDIFESYFGEALKKIGEMLELDGFRKGKIPDNILLSKVPEIRILEEMAELALSEHYPKIIEEEKIEAISRPEISITKLARKNPFGFKIKTAVLPEIKLADYKKIAKKINEIAKVEKIIADEEQVAKEVSAILEHYKGADPDRARMHAENVLTNEKIFQFLESQ